MPQPLYPVRKRTIDGRLLLPFVTDEFPCICIRRAMFSTVIKTLLYLTLSVAKGER